MFNMTLILLKFISYQKSIVAIERQTVSVFLVIYVPAVCHVNIVQAPNVIWQTGE
jgi:hypothetical protein